MAAKIVTRAEARAQGLKRYFLGTECPNGHIAERLSSNGSCYVCQLAAFRRRYEADPDKHRTRARKWYKENTELALERDRQFRIDHPEKRAALERSWKERNPDKVRTYSRVASKKWRSANPEKRKEVVRAWQDANPETMAANAHKRRARKSQAEGSHTPADLKAILSAQSHRCAYCRADLRKVKKHLDHIMPLALGGSNDRSNLQWTCHACNLSKGKKSPIEFAQQIGRLL
jgi:5-methylcytosine-specific restriction endonuclease McrA